MMGSKITQSINALILFLQSLPKKSKFNIISFGSSFERMYKTSIDYNDTNVNQTI
jgi:hypothetical protein